MNGFSEVVHDEPHQLSLWRMYLFPLDHKIITMQYLFTGMLMALIGGYFAYVFRMQLAFPGAEVRGFGVVTAVSYNSLVTNHGTIMIFWVAMPVLIAAFGNYLIPLMIGCDDMAFPRLNRLSYQIFLLSAIVLIASFFVPGGGFGGAWTAYPPLSAKATYNLTPWGATLWLVAVMFEFVAFLLGGINSIVTVMNSRAPGMRWIDIPIVIWMIVIASIVFLTSAGPLMAGAVMLLFDQTLGTTFFDPAGGGDPILWQHLFWFFGHPEVYVVLLPALGIVAEVITVFARKKLFAYKTVLFTAIAIGMLSFFIWAHHQFVAGIDPRLANVFSVTTLLISVPIAEMSFVYIATLALVMMLLFQLPFLFNFVYSMFRGTRADRNPWKANTLEWVTTSPPPHGNFETWPEVYRLPRLMNIVYVDMRRTPGRSTSKRRMFKGYSRGACRSHGHETQCNRDSHRAFSRVVAPGLRSGPVRGPDRQLSATPAALRALERQRRAYQYRRAHCTRAKQEPRLIGLPVREPYEALQAARHRQTTDAFAQP